MHLGCLAANQDGALLNTPHQSGSFQPVRGYFCSKQIQFFKILFVYSRISMSDIDRVAPKNDLVGEMQIQQPKQEVQRTVLIQVAESIYRFGLGAIAGGE